MEKALVLFVAVLVCYGCGRTSISDPGEVRSVVRPPELVIDSFNDEPGILTSASLIRVGSYFDFSSYDSLLISFHARRLSAERPFDVVQVKIGPAALLRDTLYADQENVSLSLSVSDIAKPASSAFTLRTPDLQTALEISHLRVVGWVRK